MITRSSNLATNLLIERADPVRIRATLAEIGAEGMEVLRGVEDLPAFRQGLNNTTTALAFARVLEYLARCERGEDARLGLSPVACAEMTDVLAGQHFLDKIPAGLPEGVRVANKTGWITGIDHDGAIVYPSGRAPYVLVVLTRGFEERAIARATAADLSRIVWEGWSKRASRAYRRCPATRSGPPLQPRPPTTGPRRTFGPRTTASRSTRATASTPSRTGSSPTPSTGRPLARSWTPRPS